MVKMIGFWATQPAWRGSKGTRVNSAGTFVAIVPPDQRR